MAALPARSARQKSKTSSDGSAGPGEILTSQEHIPRSKVPTMLPSVSVVVLGIVAGVLDAEEAGVAALARRERLEDIVEKRQCVSSSVNRLW